MRLALDHDANGTNTTSLADLETRDVHIQNLIWDENIKIIFFAKKILPKKANFYFWGVVLTNN